MTTIAELQAGGMISWHGQTDWFSPTESTAHVNIVGVGGVGSFVGLALSKLGIPKLTFIDPDIVEAHNIPNQAYSQHDANELKVNALHGLCSTFGGSEIETYHAKVTESGFEPVEEDGEFPARLSGIVVSALDCMDARAHLWNQVQMNIHVPLLIDARLGGESIVIYSCVPHSLDDIRKYEETLHTNGEAREDTCTRHAIIDVGFTVASLITRQIRKHLAGDEIDNCIYFNQSDLTVMKGDYVS